MLVNETLNPSSGTLGSPGSDHAHRLGAHDNQRKRNKQESTMNSSRQGSWLQNQQHQMQQLRAPEETILDLDDACTQRMHMNDGSIKAIRFYDQDGAFSLMPTKKTFKATPLSAKDEILALKNEIEALGQSLSQLAIHWRSADLPSSVLYRACEAAREKTLSKRSEELNKQLRAELLQQQIYMASLQRAFTESPLAERSEECIERFRSMHQGIVLEDVGSQQRIEQLQLRCDVTTRLAPGLVTDFTQRNMREATPALPFSRFSVAADAKYTYVSSTLIAKIPGMTLEQVYHATLGYFFEDEADDMKHYFGIWRSTTAVHSLGGIHYYARVKYFSASGFSATCNSVISAELSDSIFTICVDFVDSDKRFPKDSQYRTRREPCIMITATPARDPATGLDCVLLRQVVVIRYNLLPNSQLLHEEIRTAQSLSNGDLLIARICRHFRGQQQRSTSSQDQHHHNALKTQTYTR